MMKANSRVYETLRSWLIAGRFQPGTGVRFRQLAEELGTSVTPVREAVHRLVSDGALELRENRRLIVPEMTQPRFEHLMRIRTLIEPEAAKLALPNIDSASLKRLYLEDELLGEAIETRDFKRYMESNYQFHFQIYRLSHSAVFVKVIESIWLQFAPYMRLVYEQYGSADLVDQHERALAAIADRDEVALMQAIRDDIIDGMSLIGRRVL